MPLASGPRSTLRLQPRWTQSLDRRRRRWLAGPRAAAGRSVRTPGESAPSPRTRGDGGSVRAQAWVRRALVGCALPLALAACASPASPKDRAPAVAMAPSPVASTALVMAGLRAEARGETTTALAHYQHALAEAERAYGAAHPNTAFARAALGVWHARFGRVADALPHLRASQRIEATHGPVFVNIAETRLPADGRDPVSRALVRMRLQRDLVLCALDGGCSPARVLALGEGLGEVSP